MKLNIGITLFIAGLLCAGNATAGSRPNMILIFADDMGYGDVGYHGNDRILTPNIDALAAEGVHFTQGYTTASVCGPSRAGLLTGVYQQRFGLGENISGDGYPKKTLKVAGLPRSQTMIAETLQAQGYTTGMVGKWHLGFEKELRPNRRGFDFYFGFLNGAHDYTLWTNEFGKKKGLWPLFRNEEMLPPQQNVYLTDLFSDEAVNFIERHADDDDPFFLYVAYNAVHHPWQATPQTLERTAMLSDSEDFNVFAAMVLSMDDGIGRIRSVLKDRGIDRNTMVIFISDNGSPAGQGLKPRKKDFTIHRGGGPMSSAGIFRGFKGDTYEGGIRVPFLIRWPEGIPANKRYDLPVSTLDIAPTLAGLAGADTSRPADNGLPYDGVDLLTFLQNGTQDKRPHDTLYWRRDDDYAIRAGDWKLAWNDAHGSAQIHLFDLTQDPGEYTNLATRHPDIAQQLQDKFDAWDSLLPDSAIAGTPSNRNRRFHDGARVDVAAFNRKVESSTQAARKN